MVILFDMQISYLQQAINEYNKAKISIENVGKKEKDSEMLIPLGGGTFVKANKVDKDKILIDIGSGYIIEKNTKDSINKIDERITEIDNNLKKINEMKIKTEKEATEIYQKAQKMYQDQLGQ